MITPAFPYLCTIDFGTMNLPTPGLPIPPKRSRKGRTHAVTPNESEAFLEGLKSSFEEAFNDKGTNAKSWITSLKDECTK